MVPPGQYLSQKTSQYVPQSHANLVSAREPTTTTTTTTTRTTICCVVVPLATRLGLSTFSDSSLAQYRDTFGRSPTTAFISLNFNPTPPLIIMFNATPVLHLRPFIPLRSTIPIPLRPAHVCKKQFRLLMFPFALRFWRQLTRAQSARLRIMRKPYVQRLHQLKQCARLLEQSKNALKDLDQMQSTFIDLAQQVHHIRAAVNYEIIGPPFDGYTYIWNWKSIIIRFCGSNYYFRIIFDFTRYISPACSEYALVVH